MDPGKLSTLNPGLSLQSRLPVGSLQSPQPEPQTSTTPLEQGETLSRTGLVWGNGNGTTEGKSVWEVTQANKRTLNKSILLSDIKHEPII